MQDRRLGRLCRRCLIGTDCLLRVQRRLTARTQSHPPLFAQFPNYLLFIATSHGGDCACRANRFCETVSSGKIVRQIRSRAVGAARLQEFVHFRDLDPTRLRVLATRSFVYTIAPGSTLLDLGRADPQTMYLLEGTVFLTAADDAGHPVEGGSARASHPVVFLKPHKYTVTTPTKVSFLLDPRHAASRAVCPPNPAIRTGAGPKPGIRRRSRLRTGRSPPPPLAEAARKLPVSVQPERAPANRAPRLAENCRTGVRELNKHRRKPVTENPLLAHLTDEHSGSEDHDSGAHSRHPPIRGKYSPRRRVRPSSFDMIFA